ncbi:MAG: polysaccharide biosynthesis C-terminal domain-containing protein [Saprospiraceae bacterium]
MKKDIVGTFGTRIISIGLGIVNSVFLTRMLGVGGKGEMAIFIASISLFTLIFGLGLQPAVTYFGARKELDFSKYFNTLSLYAIVAGFFFFVVVHLYNSNYDTSVFLHKNRNSLLYELLLCISIVLMIIGNHSMAVYSALKKFKLLNTLQVFMVCVSLLTYGFLYFTNETFWQIPIKYIFIAYVGLSCFGFIINVGCLFYYKIYFFTTKFIDRTTVIKLFGFASLAYLGNLAQFLNYRIDLWLVDIYAGVTELGLYALGGNLAQMLWVLPQAIASVLLPYIATGPQEMINKTLAIGRLSLILCGCVALLSVFIMEDLIIILYGQEFAKSAFVFIILLIGTIPFCLSVVYGSFLAGTNNMKINMMSAFIGLVITLVLDIILIPIYGSIGAAIASSFSYLFSTFYLVLKMKKITTATYYDMIIPQRADYLLIKSNIYAISKKFTT